MNWRITARKTFAESLRQAQSAKDGAIADAKMAIETPMIVT